MQDKVKQFSDVIPVQNKRAYVNSLFDGNNINSAYSTYYLKKIQDLKIEALKLVAQNQLKGSGKKHSFSDVATKLGKLWESVISENFAFAFQNATAIIAFKDLEQIQKAHVDQIIDEIEKHI